MRTDRRQGGFTLIEVLIALVITVFVAGVSFMTLSTVIDGVEVLRRASSQTNDLNRLWTLLSRDLRHFTPRPVRDEFGQLRPALAGGELAGDTLSFTRLGWHNGNQRPRSNLQRVRYGLEGDTLWREHYLVLDRADDSEPMRVDLVDGVERIEFAFMAPNSEIDLEDFDSEDWPRNWAAIDNTGAGNVPAPLAVEITLELEGLGEIRRLFEIPRGRTTN
jgi:general secretion pathway protein J